MDSLRGHLLIAAATLIDPNFARTVVLVAEHAEGGAMGVVLNRASPVPVAEVAPELSDLPEPGARVHVGGPVQPSGVVVLAEFDDPAQAAAVVLGDLGFVPVDAEPDELAQSVRRARVFAGHAGWGPGQLDAEVDNDDWFLLADPAREEIFVEEPEELWSDVLTRMGGQYALVARMPLDPTVN